MFEIRGKKILLLKLRYIGDTLSISPVIDNIKAWDQNTIVDVMVNKGTEDLLAHHPGIGKLWVYDKPKAQKNLISSINYHINLIKRLRSEKYEFVIDFTHGDRAAFLAFMSRAPIRLTYQNAGTLSHILMNQVIYSEPFGNHIIDNQLKSLELFGIKNSSRNLSLFIPESITKKVSKEIDDSSIHPDSLKVVIHPGAGGKLRVWKAERFAEIARRLKNDFNACLILLGGPTERDAIDKIERNMGFPAAYRSTRLSLLELAAFIGQCQLFIGNDSAPAHIASAMNCPGVTLFGPTFPQMWQPLNSKSDHVFKNVPCCGCRQETCIRPEENCMDLIEVDEVWEKTEKLLVAF